VLCKEEAKALVGGWCGGGVGGVNELA